MVQRWVFSALDTLFFRDGTPYHAGEGGYTGVRSFFPPFATTLQGVVRTSLALDRAWTPGRALPVELGDADSLGDIRLYGPYVYAGDRPYFPLPLNILTRTGTSDTLEFIRLCPGDYVDCDLGTVRLPAPVRPAQGAKSGGGYWVSGDGMGAVLAGKAPPADQVVGQDRLWTEEARVGLERNNQTRTAVQGKLYNCAHVRPGGSTRLVVLVQGVPDDWVVRRERVTLVGGEGRPAGVSVDRIDAPQDILPGVPDLNQKGKKLRFTVTLATPGWYGDEDIEKKVVKHGPPGVPGRCVSACVGKPELVGGWDLANNRPRPQHPVIPAGSTWFYESDDTVDTVVSLHGRCLGDRSAYGFGQILIGRWDDTQ